MLTSKQKHQIIGAVIILALGVIFVPIFLTHTKQRFDHLHIAQGVPSTPNRVDSAPEFVEQSMLLNADHPESLLEPAPIQEPSETAVEIKHAIDLTDASQDPFEAVNQRVAATVSKGAKAKEAARARELEAAKLEERKAEAEMKAAEKDAATVANHIPVVSAGPQVKVAQVEALRKPHKHAAPTGVPTALKHVKHPEAWTIRLGTFSKPTNAMRLQSTLRDKGFSAYLKRVNHHRHLIQVYVGPEIQKGNAVALRNRLFDVTHLKGVVTKYKPTG